MEWQQLLMENTALINAQVVQIGLEREGQRVTVTGHLADTALSPTLISELSGLQRDFAETQLELVTQPQASAVAALHALTMLTQQVRQRLLPELIWPLSMPPTLPREDRDIPIAKLDAAAVAYRQGLAHRYGRRRQMLSGVHCNVSLAASLMMGLYQAQTDSRDFTTFQNHCYLHIAQNYLHYRWLLTYLYGCSPCCWPQSGLTPPAQPVRSLRNSSSGYTNWPGVTVSYASLNDYCQTLQAAVDNGKLSATKEFYGQVRLRHAGGHSQLCQDGIQYLELRNLDLNPWAGAGIDLSQLTCLTWFVLLMLWLPVPASTDNWIQAGQHANEQVAIETPMQVTRQLTEGEQLADALQTMATSLHQPHALQVAQHILTSLHDPANTLAARWEQQTNDSLERATQLALQLATTPHFNA